MKHHTLVTEAELLGICPCLVKNAESLMLILRTNPSQNFSHINYAITLDQAIRLRDDINDLLKEYEIEEVEE